MTYKRLEELIHAFNRGMSSSTRYNPDTNVYSHSLSFKKADVQYRIDKQNLINAIVDQILEGDGTGNQKPMGYYKIALRPDTSKQLDDHLNKLISKTYSSFV
jgi:hypothetical protein